MPVCTRGVGFEGVEDEGVVDGKEVVVAVEEDVVEEEEENCLLA